MEGYAEQGAEGAAHGQEAEEPMMHSMPIVEDAYLPHVAGNGAAEAQPAAAEAGPAGGYNTAEEQRYAHVVSGSGKTRTGPLFCQVETCRAPLEGLKEYHQRYKVCEQHLKMEFIERDGAKVRFCQQCGRFQPLEDFDDNKRSCRARLQRHNARRRKRARDTFGLGGGGGDVAAAMGVDDMAAVHEAIQFASATLVHTTSQHAGGGGGAAAHQGGEQDPAAAAAAIAGLPFGGGLTAMPYVPSPQVLLLLLKGYAGMFHYVLEDVQLRPLAEPTPLTLPQAGDASAMAAAAQADASVMAAAVAAAAAMAPAAAPHEHEASVASFMAMHAGALGAPSFMDAAAAAAAAAAAMAGGGAAAPQGQQAQQQGQEQSKQQERPQQRQEAQALQEEAGGEAVGGAGGNHDKGSARDGGRPHHEQA